MSTVYVSTMILRSMRMTGEKTRGDTLTSNEQTECLSEINSMIESWSLSPLLCYQLQQYSVSLSVSTSSFTVGPGATLSTTVRPNKIVDPCFVRDSSNMDTPLQIISPESYGGIVMKGTGTTYPTYITYNQGLDSSGFGTINIYPTPSAGLTLFVNTQQAVGSFSAVSTQVTLPQGYQLAIESNYAIHSVAGIGSVSPEVVKIARESLSAIKSQNLPETISRLDTGVVQPYRGSGRSILTGP